MLWRRREKNVTKGAARFDSVRGSWPGIFESNLKNLHWNFQIMSSVKSESYLYPDSWSDIFKHRWNSNRYCNHQQCLKSNKDGRITVILPNYSKYRGLLRRRSLVRQVPSLSTHGFQKNRATFFPKGWLIKRVLWSQKSPVWVPCSAFRLEVFRNLRSSPFSHRP